MKSELKASSCLLILVFVVLGLYYPSIFAPINSVDDPAMLQHLLNSDDLTMGDIFLPGGSGSYFRPVVLATFLADKHLWGLQESFMHLENVLLHLANTLLVFWLAWRGALLCGRKPQAVAFAAGLVFAIHPINTEAINWISGRTDLLAGLFLFLSALLLLRRPLPLWASLGSAVLLLTACLAKETAIFLLPAALLAPLFLAEEGRESLLERCFRHAPHLAVFISAGIGYFLFRRIAFAQGDQGVARVITHVAGEQSAGMLNNLRLVLKALGFYGKKILYPFPLNFGITHVSDWYLLAGVVLCLAVACLLARRTVPGFFFISAAAVICSALMIPLLRLTWTPLAERYLYIPGGFFLVGTALVLQKQIPPRRQQLAVLSLALVALVALTGSYRRNLLWQDNAALFRDTIEKSPDFMPARNQLAYELFGQGRKEEAGAIYKSFKDDPALVNRQYGLVNKAFALAQEGKYDEARRILNQALQDPGKHEVLILSKSLEVNKLQAMKDKASAAALYQDNVRLLTRMCELTGDPFYQYRLGLVELQDGSRDKARSAFEAAAKRAPASAYYRSSAQKLCATLAAGPAAGRGEDRKR